ncbi:MAG TPA: hypothetical protein VK473_12625 [Terriglobales bacterium]|nr:hypothetical protein [Terriglobales bacterium]
MKSRVVLVISLLFHLAVPLLGQQMDSQLRGEWNLNVGKSSFGPGPAPKAGHVSWTEHGWVFAIITPGGIYADAVMTDNGCTLIGVPNEYSCAIQLLTPRHLRFTMKEAGAVRRVGDIELLDKNTTKTTHRVTLKDGESFTETTIWERESE